MRRICIFSEPIVIVINENFRKTTNIFGLTNLIVVMKPKASGYVIDNIADYNEIICGSNQKFNIAPK